MFREDNYEIGGQFLWSNCSIHLVAGLTANQDENWKTGLPVILTLGERVHGKSLRCKTTITKNDYL